MGGNVLTEVLHKQKGMATSWTVAGLGLAVTGVGKRSAATCAGIMGFGLAHGHGLLDMLCPTVRH